MNMKRWSAGRIAAAAMLLCVPVVSSACRDRSVTHVDDAQLDLISGNDSTLTVGLFPGVTGFVTHLDAAGQIRTDTIPGDTSVDYRKGAVQQYEFRADSGYQGVDAMLDSLDVPAAATLSPQAVGLLAASASRILALPTDAEALGQRYRDLLSATDRASAYRAVRTQARALARRVGAEEARRLGAIAFHRSLSIEEADSVQIIIAQLPDSVLATPDSSGAQLRRSSLRGSRMRGMTSGTRSTVVLYINGIDTYDFENELSTGRIREHGASVGGLESAVFEGFYNRTAAVQPRTQRLCRLARSRIVALRLEGPSALRKSGVVTFCNKVDDVIESGIQLANIVSGYHLQVQEDARFFADAIERHLDAGKKVVVVAHSQGNLMTMEALNTIFTRRPNRKEQTADCLAVVSVASPSAATQVSTSGGTSSAFQRVMIKGGAVKDVILRVPGNSDAGAFPNGLATFYDQELQRHWWTRWGGAYRAVTILKYDAALHALDDSYLKYPETRTVIQQALGAETTTAEAACRGPAVRIDPDPDALVAPLGSTTPLAPRVVDAYGKALSGYTFTFTSSDASVAAVDSATGVVTASSLGSAVVTISASGSGGAVPAVQVPVRVTRAPASITLTAPRDTLTRPDQMQMAVAVLDANGEPIEGLPLTWAMGYGYPQWGSVSASGLVATGEWTGSVWVVAHINGVYGVKELHVVEPTVVIAPLARDTLTRPDSVRFTATVLDAYGQAKNTPVTWLMADYPGWGTLGQDGWFRTADYVGDWHVAARAAGGYASRSFTIVEPTITLSPGPRIFVNRPASVQFTADVRDAYGQPKAVPVRWAQPPYWQWGHVNSTGLFTTSEWEGTTDIAAWAGGAVASVTIDIDKATR